MSSTVSEQVKWAHLIRKADRVNEAMRKQNAEVHRREIFRDLWNDLWRTFNDHGVELRLGRDCVIEDGDVLLGEEFTYMIVGKMYAAARDIIGEELGR